MKSYLGYNAQARARPNIHFAKVAKTHLTYFAF